MKNYLLFALVVTLFFSCGSNNTKQKNKETDSSKTVTATTETKTDLNTKDLPIKLSVKEIEQIKTVLLPEPLTTSFLDTVNKGGYGECTNPSICFSVNTGKQWIYLIHAKIKYTDHEESNYWLATANSQNKIVSTLEINDNDEMDGSWFSDLKIEKDTDNLISIELIYPSEEFIPIEKFKDKLSKEEKFKFSHSTKNYTITANNEIKSTLKDNFNWQEAKKGTFVGTIDDKHVVFQFPNRLYFEEFHAEEIVYENIPAEMSSGIEYTAFASFLDKKIHLWLNFYGSDTIYGIYDENQLVRLSRSDKNMTLLNPNSLHRYSSDPDFEKYLDFFADESSNPLKLSSKTVLEYADAYDKKESTLVSKAFRKEFLDFAYSLDAHPSANFYYGFAYKNPHSISCLLFVRENPGSPGNEAYYSYALAEYEYNGMIKSFDVYTELPKELTLRAYDAASDEPKNLFNTGSYGYTFNKIRMYIDIPKFSGKRQIIINQKNEDGALNELYNQFIEGNPDILKLHYFELNGNFGCDSLLFKVLSEKGEVLKTAGIEMHCGE